MSYNLGTAEGRITIDGSGASRGFKVAEVAASAFFGVIQNKLDSLDQLGTRLTQIGATGSAGLGIAVRAAANFEQGLSNVRAVSGATEEEMDSLRKAALRIGKDTSFSATEATQAMEELVKAGVSTSDVLNGAADATVALAAAGGVSLPEAATIASNALNQFNLEGKDMAHVADLIAGAANASAIDVGDFGFSLSQAGAVANLTGLKFDDLAVAIAEMGNAGIKGSDAGTSIKTFLTNLIPTMDKQVAKFEELGLMTVNTGKAMGFLAQNGIKPTDQSIGAINVGLQEYIEKMGGAEVGTEANAKAAQKLANAEGLMSNAFFDANGNIKSFADIQQTLQDATKNLTREQKLATLETLFGSDAIRAAAVFAEEGAAGYNKMATAMGKVGAAEVAKTRLDNLNGSIEELKGSFETMLIVIGEVFLPIVRKVVEGLTFLVNIFNNLPEPVQQAIAVMLGLGTAMTLLAGLFIKLLFFATPLLAKFLGFAALRQIFSIFTVGFKAMRGGQGAMAALALTAGRAGVVFARFQKIGKALMAALVRFPKILAALRYAWALAFGPWGIAIAAVVAAIVIAYKKFEPFRNLVNSIGAAIRSGFIAALNGLKAAWQAVIAGFNGANGDGILGFFMDLGLGARVLWEALKRLGDAFMKNVVPALKAAGGMLLAALVDAWKTLAATFQSSIVPAAKDLWVALQSLMPALKQLWAALWPILKIVGMVAAVIIGVLLIALYQIVKFIVAQVLPVIIKFTAFLLVGLVKAITVVVQVLTVIIGALIKFIAVIVGAIMPGLKLLVSFWKFQWDLIYNVVSTVISAVVTVIRTYLGILTSVWSAVWGVLGPVVKAVWDLIYNIVKLAVAVVVLAVSSQIDRVVKLWRAGWELVQRIVQAVWKVIGPYVTRAVNTMRAALQAAWNAIQGATSRAWQLVQKYIITPLQAAYARVRSVISSVQSAIGAAWNFVTSRTRSAWNTFSQTVQSAVNRLRSIIGTIRGIITGPFSGAGNWLRDIGRRIIDGLISGIRSAIGGVKSLLNSVTGMIPDWKGPMSVDKKLLTPNGREIMRSLIAGLMAAAPELQSMLMDFTRQIPGMVAPNRTLPLPVAGGGGNVVPIRRPVEASSGPSHVIHNNWNVYNPVAEKTSRTTSREATRRANLGMIA